MNSNLFSKGIVSTTFSIWLHILQWFRIYVVMRTAPLLATNVAPGAVVCGIAVPSARPLFGQVTKRFVNASSSPWRTHEHFCAVTLTVCRLFVSRGGRTPVRLRGCLLV
jgi:hypothetical protein